MVLRGDSPLHGQPCSQLRWAIPASCGGAGIRWQTLKYHACGAFTSSPSQAAEEHSAMSSTAGAKSVLTGARLLLLLGMHSGIVPPGGEQRQCRPSVQ